LKPEQFENFWYQYVIKLYRNLYPTGLQPTEENRLQNCQIIVLTDSTESKHDQNYKINNYRIQVVNEYSFIYIEAISKMKGINTRTEAKLMF